MEYAENASTTKVVTAAIIMIMNMNGVILIDPGDGENIGIRLSAAIVNVGY